MLANTRLLGLAKVPSAYSAVESAVVVRLVSADLAILLAVGVRCALTALVPLNIATQAPVLSL